MKRVRNLKNIIVVLVIVLLGVSISCSSDDTINTPDETTTLNTENDITQFVFTAVNNVDITNDVIATITANEITFIVPFGTDITKLQPELTISEGAQVSPKGAQDFSNGTISYTVTAADGNIKEYLVSVSNDINILVALYMANVQSQSELGWDITSNAIADWNGVTVTNGRVTTLSLSFKKLQNIPTSIGELTHLETLRLGFNELTTLPPEGL